MPAIVYKSCDTRKTASLLFSRLLTSLYDELPEEYRNINLLQWANILDISSDATNIPMFFANILGIFTNVVGMIDNYNAIIRSIG